MYCQSATFLWFTTSQCRISKYSQIRSDSLNCRTHKYSWLRCKQTFKRKLFQILELEREYCPVALIYAFAWLLHSLQFSGYSEGLHVFWACQLLVVCNVNVDL